MPIASPSTIFQGKVPADLPIFVCDLSDQREVLDLARAALDDLRRDHPESTPSNVKAVYMSPWKSHVLTDKLLPLCKTACWVARQAAHRICTFDLSFIEVDMVVTDCWIAVYEEGDRTVRHNHFPADFGCVVYLEAEPGCAPLVFAGKTAHQPTPGSMVLFPGILDHEVPATPGRRVVVAMNLAKRSTMFADGPMPSAPVPAAVPAQAAAPAA